MIDQATYISLAVMASMTLAKDNVTGQKHARTIAREACDIVDAVLEEVECRRPEKDEDVEPASPPFPSDHCPDCGHVRHLGPCP